MNKEKMKQVENRLYSYNKTKTEIENLNLDLQAIDGLKGISYDEKGSTTNAFNSVVENVLIRQEEIKNKIFYKEIENKKIENIINSKILNEKEREFIEDKYLKNKSNIEVATNINIALSYVNEFRLKTLNKIKDFL